MNELLRQVLAAPEVAGYWWLGLRDALAFVTDGAAFAQYGGPVL